MERDYNGTIKNDVQFFTGVEVEKTLAYGKQTLFVTGLQDYNTIKDWYTNLNCEHIFFGANHSYNPKTNDEFEDWELMIKAFLQEGILCSLDIPSTVNLEWVLEGGYVEFNNFIPQIRVVIPYIKQWNYNTSIKIDDKGYNKTNPGVWSHTLHDLMDHSKFTSWDKYTKDKEIE